MSQARSRPSLVGLVRDLPNLFTLAGLAAAVLGVFFALRGIYPAAMMALVWAVVFDWTDGIIARRMSARTADQRSFGAQLDSLVDIVSFSVAPALVLLSVGDFSAWFVPGAFVILAAGAIRLSYFNVFGLLGGSELSRSLAGQQRPRPGAPVRGGATPPRDELRHRRVRDCCWSWPPSTWPHSRRPSSPEAGTGRSSHTRVRSAWSTHGSCGDPGATQAGGVVRFRSAISLRESALEKMATAIVGRAMSNETRILDALAAADGPLCDDCITQGIGWNHRQQAHSVCSRMSEERETIIRAHGFCSGCGRRKIVNGLPLWAVGQAELQTAAATDDEKARIVDRPRGGQLRGAVAAEVGVAPVTFGPVRDLQSALRSDIEQLEPGLKITDGGSESVTEAGRIAITASDKDGSTVIIDLEAGQAAPEALTRLLACMGATAEQDQSRIRGLLVAEHFHPLIVFAVKALPNVRLCRYRGRFTFEAME